ncbi:MAG: tryptophan--tRNA ligase [Helicobacter sp.]|nr:tryptophan--tRNA ligase [Helicobacter sp.]
MQSKSLRAFSGIQPTGSLHLGNYLGAIKNWLELQNNGLNSHIFNEKKQKNDSNLENIFCIVNSHAITSLRDAEQLRQNTLETACMLFACGLDPDSSIIFIQSEILEHPALAWILDCNIFMGEMNRMTQFKDKSAQNPQNINVGLFNYPALMAADILLYDANLVPVGADQKQHIELTRNVAARFNAHFAKNENKEKTEGFIIPDPLIVGESAKIMGLDNPQIKMSKSIKSQNHAIFLLDSESEIDKKIKKAQTDNFNEIIFSDDPLRAGVKNLLSIYQIFSSKTKEQIEHHFEGKGYGALKSELSELVISHLKPIRTKYLQLLDDKSYINSALQNGKNRAQEIASSTYKRISDLVGLQI